MKNTPAPLFLYVTGTTMSPALLKRIEKAGYIPVEVPSMDAVKVLDPVPVASLDPICRAAFDTIGATGWNEVPQNFGRSVARALGTQKAPV
jgi:hypothetical protein